MAASGCIALILAHAVFGSVVRIEDDGKMAREAEAETTEMGTREVKFCKAFTALGPKRGTSEEPKLKAVFPDWQAHVEKSPTYFFVPFCQLVPSEGEEEDKFQLSITFKHLKTMKVMGRLQTEWLTTSEMRNCIQKEPANMKTDMAAALFKRNVRSGAFSFSIVANFDDMAPLLRPQSPKLQQHEELFANLKWWKLWCTSKFRLEFEAGDNFFYGMWLFRESQCNEFDINRGPGVGLAGEIWKTLMVTMHGYMNALRKFITAGGFTSLGAGGEKIFEEGEGELLDRFGVPSGGQQYLPGMPGVLPPSEQPAAGYQIPFHEIWAWLINDKTVVDSDYAEGNHMVVDTLKKTYLEELFQHEAADWEKMKADLSVVDKGAFRTVLMEAIDDPNFPIFSFKRGKRMVDGHVERGPIGHENPPHPRMKGYEDRLLDELENADVDASPTIGLGHRDLVKIDAPAVPPTVPVEDE